MKKMILSLVALLSIATVSAQEFSWGVKAGVNLSTIGGSAVYEYKAGFTGGVFAEVKTCDWFGLGAEVLYSGQGAAIKKGITMYDSRVYNELSYINVPILANFHLNKTIALKTGLQPGFLVGKVVRSGSESSTMSGLNTFDLAIPVAIEFQLDCGLLFDVRYNVGLLNINKQGDNCNNSTFAFTVGWRF